MERIASSDVMGRISKLVYGYAYELDGVSQRSKRCGGFQRGDLGTMMSQVIPMLDHHVNGAADGEVPCVGIGTSMMPRTICNDHGKESPRECKGSGIVTVGKNAWKEIGRRAPVNVSEWPGCAICDGRAVKDAARSASWASLRRFLGACVADAEDSFAHMHAIILNGISVQQGQ